MLQLDFLEVDFLRHLVWQLHQQRLDLRQLMMAKFNGEASVSEAGVAWMGTKSTDGALMPLVISKSFIEVKAAKNALQWLEWTDCRC